MSLEVNPVGQTCNIKCAYCYEQPMRDAGNITQKLDLPAIFKVLDSEQSDFSLFGGEPLLASLETLQKLFDYGFKKHGRNGVQTNGTLITPAHFDLFSHYNVHVGFSIDGPHPINSIRCVEELTNLSIANLKLCLEKNTSTSLIITIHEAHYKNQDLFFSWLDELDKLGLKSARLHFLERDNNVKAMNEDHLIEILSRLDRLELEYKNIKFDLFGEIYTLLQNPLANVTCVWNGCDPLTTSAVQGIGPSGERYNCGRTNKEGINWRKASESGRERQIALYANDCKDCRFFLACKGYCPGTAIDGDWRRKTEHCGVLKKLFSIAERRLVESRIKVYSLDENLKQRESDYLNSLSNQPSGTGCVERSEHIDWHIDSNAKIQRTGNIPVGR